MGVTDVVLAYKISKLWTRKLLQGIFIKGIFLESNFSKLKLKRKQVKLESQNTSGWEVHQMVLFVEKISVGHIDFPVKVDIMWV